MAKPKSHKLLRQKYNRTSYMKPFKGKTTVKLNDLLSPSLGEALRALGHKEVDIKCAWAISKIMEERVAHAKTLEEARKIILEKYCVKDEQGEYKTTEDKTQYILTDDKAFHEEYAKLVDVEVEVTR